MYWKIACALFVFLLLLDVFLVEPRWLKITKRKIAISDLKEPLHILWLSDLQLREDWGFREKWILRNLNDWNFDVVCVTGDVFDKPAGVAPAIRFLQQISRNKPTYVVLGNWEHWAEADLHSYKKELMQMGVSLLVNESETLAWNEQRITMVGVDDPSTFHDRLFIALRNSDPQTVRILLAHAPAIFPTAARKGIDLVLAGHTHGGQVRIPFLGPLYLPPGCGHFVYGVYRSMNSTLVVTSGIGTSVFPARFNCRPEVVLIELTTKTPRHERG